MLRVVFRIVFLHNIGDPRAADTADHSSKGVPKFSRSRAEVSSNRIRRICDVTAIKGFGSKVKDVAASLFAGMCRLIGCWIAAECERSTTYRHSLSTHYSTAPST